MPFDHVRRRRRRASGGRLARQVERRRRRGARRVGGTRRRSLLRRRGRGGAAVRTVPHPARMHPVPARSVAVVPGRSGGRVLVGDGASVRQRPSRRSVSAQQRRRRQGPVARSHVAVLARTQPGDLGGGCSGCGRDDVARLVLRTRHHVERVGVAVGEDGATVDADEDALKLDLTRTPLNSAS